MAPAVAATAPGPFTSDAGPATVDPAVARAVARIRSDGDIQTAFPTPAPQKPADPPPKWLENLADWLAGDGMPWVRGLAWMLVGMAALFVLYLTVPAVRDAVRRVMGWARATAMPHDDGQDEWRPDATGARDLLAEADRLAAESRFDDAVHLLLGRSVEDIVRRRPAIWQPSLTARAIALMPELPQPVRTAFDQIAQVVERSLWARQPISADDWQHARTAYQDFAFGAHWRGAPA
ncbi:MAG: DUF4129 domain-containing protein [Sphingopyxis sp.]